MTFQQIPRVEKNVVNVVATLSSILQLQEHESQFEFLMEEPPHPTYDSFDNHVIYTIVGHNSSYYTTIFSYLCDNVIPKNVTCNQNVNSFTLHFGLW